MNSTASHEIVRGQRHRFVVLALVGVCLLAATGLGYAAYLLSQLAPIGTAYAAKMLCSGVFVSGRQPEDVIHDVLADNHPLLRFVRPALDKQRRLASATFLGMARREAQYRPGLGCTLAIGVPAQNLVGPPISPSARPRAGSLDAVALAPHTWRNELAKQKLERAIDWAFAEPDPARLRRTRAVVLLRGGRLLTERYAHGFSADTPMLGWSMSKSVTAALIGMLIREGKLTLHQRDLLPQWRGAGDPRAAITLDHLLRMTSGLRFTEDHREPLEDVALMLFARADGAAYAIDKPLEAAPGTRWSYSSGTTNVLSAIMREALGGGDSDYLAFPQRALFERIGMRHALIEPDASGTLVMSSYMHASPHDWARFGQLLLQDGVWRGKRLLPAGWVKYMATITPQSTRKDFGAHLWLKVPPPFNSLAQPPPRLPADAFHVVGHEGQFVSVIPSRRLVVVRLGLSRGDHVWDQDAFLAQLLSALTD